jgi:hypothetical protein
LNSAGNNSTPSKLKEEQTIQGEKVTLTPKQLDALSAQAGSQTAANLAELFAGDDYKSLSDEDKAAAVDSVVSQTRKQVRANFDLNSNSMAFTAPSTTNSMASTGGKKYTLVNSETGSTKSIDLTNEIEYPELTGNTELDKKLISQYKSALTTRASDIVKLYKAGKIDATTAEEELAKLTSSKANSKANGKGKAKKLTARKAPAFKAKKAPKFKFKKVAKAKTKKMAQLKVQKYKIPKKPKLS